MLEFLQNFEALYRYFIIISYILSIIGAALIVYAFFVLSLIAFTIVKAKNLTPFKAIHIFSVIEVYVFLCVLIGIILSSKIYGILLFKTLLFGIIVLFNGITATRLIAKTAYFYSMRKKTKEV